MGKFGIKDTSQSILLIFIAAKQEQIQQTIQGLQIQGTQMDAQQDVEQALPLLCNKTELIKVFKLKDNDDKWQANILTQLAVKDL